MQIAKITGYQFLRAVLIGLALAAALYSFAHGRTVYPVEQLQPAAHTDQIQPAQKESAEGNFNPQGHNVQP